MTDPTPAKDQGETKRAPGTEGNAGGESLPVHLPEPVQELLEGLEGTIEDPEKKQQLKVTIAGAIAQSAYSSPYPPPEMLRAYGEVIPGLDRTLVAKVDAQTTHRQELERNVILSNTRRADRGR